MRYIKWVLCIAAIVLLSGCTSSHDSSIFQSLTFTPPTTDLSLKYLSLIFGVVEGILHGTGSQIMGSMFRIFNSAVLAIGVIIILYTIVTTVTYTANDGEMLGKKMTHHYPLRLVGAFVLMLPKASGYCLAQIVVMWIVVQGIGAADKLWEAVLNYLANGGTIIASTNKTIGTQDILDVTGNPADPNHDTVFTDIFQSEICLFALKKELDQAYADKKLSLPPPDPYLSSLPLSSADCSINDEKGYTCTLHLPSFPANLSTGYEKYNDLCGTLTYKTGLHGAYSDAQGNSLAAGTVALQQAMSDMSYAARKVVDNAGKNGVAQQPYGECSGINDTTPPSDCGADYPNNWVAQKTGNVAPLTSGDVLLTPIQGYVGLIQPALSASLQKVDFSRKKAEGIARDGWILAGTYYWDLAAANHAAAAMKQDVLPTWGAPVSGTARDYFKDGKLCNEVNTKGLGQILPDCGTNITPIYSDSAFQTFLTSLNFYQPATQASQSHASYSDFRKLLDNITVAMVTLFPTGPVIALIVKNPIKKFLNNMGEVESSGKNPVTVLVTFGQDMLDAVYIAFVAIGWLMAGLTLVPAYAPCVNLSAAFQVLMSWQTPLLTFAMATLATTGVILAFYLPLVPFIVFTLSALGWIFAVIESMVAAPIVALGFAHPEGNELFGKAEGAPMLLLNVFLRPSMMLIGFIMGMILTYVGIWLLNAGFVYSMKEAAPSGLSGGVQFIMFIAFMVIYAVTSLTIVQKSFTLIYLLPDKIMRWISGGAQAQFGSEVAESGTREIQSTTSSGAHQFGSSVKPAQFQGMKEKKKKGKTDGDITAQDGQDSGKPDNKDGGGGVAVGPGGGAGKAVAFGTGGGGAGVGAGATLAARGQKKVHSSHTVGIGGA